MQYHTTSMSTISNYRLTLFFLVAWVSWWSADEFPTGVVTAFRPSVSSSSLSSPSRISTRRSSTTRLAATTVSTPNYDRVRQQGGGIPVVPAGSAGLHCQFTLFDPDQEGLLAGTHSVNDRIAQSFQYQYLATTSTTTTTSTASTTIPVPTTTQEAQAWLEHLDKDGVPPAAFCKPTQPVTATVLGRTPLVSEGGVGDVEHVVLQLPPGFHYVEGQSLQVIPPGINPQSGKTHKPRLYSIASTRYGDLRDGQTVSLCVRRADFYDPVTHEIDPSKAGVCSHFLCQVEPGDTVQVAGPVGKTMLLPQDSSRDVIMIATGTGVAPFRAFLHRLFVENTIARHMYTGQAWLFLGVPTFANLLYFDEFREMKEAHPDHFRVSYAVSRQMKKEDGSKYYVQDAIAEHADDLLDRMMHGNAVMYFCGLKNMMPSILETLEAKVVEHYPEEDWSALLKKWQSNGQWHVEVY